MSEAISIPRAQAVKLFEQVGKTDEGRRAAKRMAKALKKSGYIETAEAISAAITMDRGASRRGPDPLKLIINSPQLSEVERKNLVDIVDLWSQGFSHNIPAIDYEAIRVDTSASAPTTPKASPDPIPQASRRVFADWRGYIATVVVGARRHKLSAFDEGRTLADVFDNLITKRQGFRAMERAFSLRSGSLLVEFRAALHIFQLAREGCPLPSQPQDIGGE